MQANGRGKNISFMTGNYFAKIGQKYIFKFDVEEIRAISTITS